MTYEEQLVAQMQELVNKIMNGGTPSQMRSWSRQLEFLDRELDNITDDLDEEEMWDDTV